MSSLKAFARFCWEHMWLIFIVFVLSMVSAITTDVYNAPSMGDCQPRLLQHITARYPGREVMLGGCVGHSEKGQQCKVLVDGIPTIWRCDSEHFYKPQPIVIHEFMP